MKNLPPLHELQENFYDDGINLRWRKSPRYDVNPGDIAGGAHPNGYLYVKFRQENYRVHRILWLMRTGEDPGVLEIDHKNRNRSDNSLDNLRLSNKFDQAQNKGAYSNNKSGHTGVVQRGEKWLSYIDRNGSRTKLGLFSTKEEAVAARKAAETIFQALSLP